MKEILGKYEAIVEIIFALALAAALVYAIAIGDKVTAAAVIGGILGYMKGRSDLARAVTDAPPAPGGEAGFASIRLLFCLLLAFALFAFAGCASVTQNITCGETGRDTKQTTTDKTALDGNQATASPNVSLVPK